MKTKIRRKQRFIPASVALGALALIVAAGGCAREAPAVDGASSVVSEQMPVASSPGPRSKYAKKRVVATMARLDVEQDAVAFNTESYSALDENPFVRVIGHPLSTFAVDVDTASYSNTRRIIGEGRMPPVGAVRIEELINYFPYDYSGPRGDAPFGVNVEISEAPWNPDHRLARIGLQGEEIEPGNRPPANLVFLLDVSGSMTSPNKLPLLKSALKMLTDTLSADDRVAIVVYAGAAGLVLPPTHAGDKGAILDALARLDAGGSTAGGSGIRLAYQTARESFVPGAINRVILATDGDFNVGVTDESELVRLIEREAESGVFLTVLGFGGGNYKDSTLEKLADRGNGNYAYIDTALEARKVLVDQIGATLVTVAKDVKIQVEFNPARVAAYRLIGYENRLLRDADFNDDTRDAGEIGAGHSVTALYELIPAGADLELPGTDPLKYQPQRQPTPDAVSDELFTLKIRYKAPDGERSRLLDIPVTDDGGPLMAASDDFRFAAAVAGFGMILRDSRHRSGLELADVEQLARHALGRDVGGYRTEFLRLVAEAEAVSSGAPAITR